MPASYDPLLEAIARRADTLGRDHVRGWAPEIDRDLHEAYERAGFRPFRHSFRMEIELGGDLPAPEWPEGFSVRPFRAGDERAAWEAQQDSFADTWGFTPDPFETWAHWNLGEYFQPEHWFFVETGDEVAAIALCRQPESEPGLGWVNILGVRPAYRRRGLAIALLQHVFRALRGAGYDQGRPRSRRRESDRRGAALRARRHARSAARHSLRASYGIIEAWPPRSTSPSSTATFPRKPGTRRRTPTRARSAIRTTETTSSRPTCASVPHCGFHFPVRARERVTQVADEDTFEEEAADLRSEDPLDFFDVRPYPERLVEAELGTGLGDAMIIGRAAIEERPCELAVMDFSFMGGSMGSVVGEKFSRAAESAIESRVPLISITASGGARMQEGILSLMQLPKTVCAVEDLRDARCGFISVMAHPTTAGVLASFASLGDVCVAEPGALLAFTGPRVVQGTTREKLPEDFGLAESNFRYGHVDAIVPRPELRGFLAKLLRLFSHAG